VGEAEDGLMTMDSSLAWGVGVIVVSGVFWEMVRTPRVRKMANRKLINPNEVDFLERDTSGTLRDLGRVFRDVYTK
jgi:hypothetical protein